SSGWPQTPKRAQAFVNSAQSPCKACSRSASGTLLGQTQETLKGVSPQPSAEAPLRPSTRRQTRAEVTSRVVSGPNLTGIRARKGRKYNLAPIGRMSVGLPMVVDAPAFKSLRRRLHAR